VGSFDGSHVAKPFDSEQIAADVEVRQEQRDRAGSRFEPFGGAIHRFHMLNATSATKVIAHNARAMRISVPPSNVRSILTRPAGSESKYMSPIASLLIGASACHPLCHGIWTETSSPS